MILKIVARYDPLDLGYVLEILVTIVGGILVYGAMTLCCYSLFLTFCTWVASTVL